MYIEHIMFFSIMFNVNDSWAIYYPKTKKSHRKIICKVSKSFRRKEEEKQQYG